MEKAINVLVIATYNAVHTKKFLKKCLRRKKLHNEQYMTEAKVRQKRKEYAKDIIYQDDIIKQCKKAIKALENLKKQL